ERQLEGLDPPPLGKRPEKKAVELVAKMSAALRWYEETWAQCLEALAHAGLAWPRVLEQVPAGMTDAERPPAGRDELAPAIAERMQHIAARDLAATREQWIDSLKGYSNQSAAYSIVKILRNAIRGGDYDAYVDAHTKLREIEGLADEAARRRELLARL